MSAELLEKTINSTVNLLLPPLTVNTLNEAQCPDLINYDEHPAYKDLIKSADLNTKLRARMLFGKYFLIVAIKRLISYELIPAHLRKPKSLKTFGGFFKTILSTYYYKLFYKHSRSASTIGKPVFDKLKTQGICVVDINSNQFTAIETGAAAIVENLRLTRNQKKTNSREFAESRTTLLRPSNSDLFNAIQSSFIESGILEGIAHYLGKPVKIIDINPQINDISDDFWRHTFPDLNIEHPSTAYCHRDASGGDVKVIIYLSDVADDNGPFSFILGSHNKRPNRLDNFIQEINDTAGLSSVALKVRQSFAALPKFLRKKCAFGNDLNTQSPIAQQLIHSEWKITAPKGHAVIFDSKGIHRGGMVIDQERVVLTCVIG